MSTPLLTFSTLYPNACQPGHGSFVETRLHALKAVGDYDARVLAPVPWFPSTAEIFGDYAKFAGVPAHENLHGVDVWHPRYLVIPKIGMNLAPGALFRSAMRSLKQWTRDEFKPALIDAHYFFPDGVAAARLAKRLKVPLIITARGSDINLIGNYRGPLAMMRKAAQRAQAIVAVSQALADRMVELGFDREKIHVLRNGVDLDAFRPGDRDGVRARLGLSGRVLLSAGNLVALKGHDLVIDAMTKLDDTNLLIAGEGPRLSELRAQVARLGLDERVCFLGRVPKAQMRDLYLAADALVLASSREGLANVLVEAVACGTPVVATAVGGNPEIVCDPRAGVLMEERTSAAIIAAIERLESQSLTSSATREFAMRFGWQDTCHKLDALIQSIM